MKIRQLSVTSVVLSLFVGVMAGLAWWAGAPASAAPIPIVTTTILIPISGTVTGQPENVGFSGQAQVSSDLVQDASRFQAPPAVFLTIDLSNVSGTGLSTGAKYVAGDKESPVIRKLVSSDTVEVTFPVYRSTATGMSATRWGVASFVLNFDLSTGALTSGTGSIATPSFPN